MLANLVHQHALGPQKPGHVVAGPQRDAGDGGNHGLGVAVHRCLDGWVPFVDLGVDVSLRVALGRRGRVDRFGVADVVLYKVVWGGMVPGAMYRDMKKVAGLQGWRKERCP